MDLLLKRSLVHISQKQRERCEFDYCVAREGGCIEVLYHGQAMVWCSGVVLIM